MARRTSRHAHTGGATQLPDRLRAARARAQQSWLASTLMPGSLTAAATSFGLRLSRAEPYMGIRIPEWEAAPIGTLSLLTTYLAFRLLARPLAQRFNRRKTLVAMVVGLSLAQMAEAWATTSTMLIVLSCLVGVQCVESLARGLIEDNVETKRDRVRSGRHIRRDGKRRSALTTAAFSGILGIFDVVFPLCILLMGTRATFLWFGASTLPLAGLGWWLLPDDVNKPHASVRLARGGGTAKRSVVLVGRVSLVNGFLYGIFVGVLAWVLREHFSAPGRPAYLSLLLLAAFSLRRLPLWITNPLAERLATRPDEATVAGQRPHRVVRPAALPEAAASMVVAVLPWIAALLLPRAGVLVIGMLLGLTWLLVEVTRGFMWTLLLLVAEDAGAVEPVTGKTTLGMALGAYGAIQAFAIAPHLAVLGRLPVTERGDAVVIGLFLAVAILGGLPLPVIAMRSIQQAQLALRPYTRGELIVFGEFRPVVRLPDGTREKFAGCRLDVLAGGVNSVAATELGRNLSPWMALVPQQRIGYLVGPALRLLPWRAGWVLVRVYRGTRVMLAETTDGRAISVVTSAGRTGWSRELELRPPYRRSPALLRRPLSSLRMGVEPSGRRGLHSGAGIDRIMLTVDSALVAVFMVSGVLLHSGLSLAAGVLATAWVVAALPAVLQRRWPHNAARRTSLERLAWLCVASQAGVTAPIAIMTTDKHGGLLGLLDRGTGLMLAAAVLAVAIWNAANNRGCVGGPAEGSQPAAPRQPRRQR